MRNIAKLLCNTVNPDFPLENVSPEDVGAFYSLRKGRRNYNGSAIRMLREYDNAEIDIGCNPDGSFDSLSATNCCKTYLHGSYLNLNGKSGSYSSTSSTAALQVTTDFKLIVKANIEWGSLTKTQTLLTKRSANTGEFHFRVGSGSVNRLVLICYGSSTFIYTSTAALPQTSNTNLWVKVEKDTSVRFYYSIDGVNWTQLGDDVTLLNASQTATANPVLTGGYSLGTFDRAEGKIYRAQIYNATNTLVYDANFETATAEATSFVESASGLTVNVVASQTSGFIKTWYEQNGNGYHVSQATVANMPRIVNAGVVETKDGFPAVRFRYSGSTAVSKLLNTSMTGLALQNTVFVVGSLETTQTFDQSICELYSGTERNILTHKPTADNNAVSVNAVIATTPYRAYSLGALVCHRMRIKPAGTDTINYTANDVSALSTSVLRSTTPTSFIIGDDSTGDNDFYGYISEILIGKNMAISNADWVQACLMRRYVKGGLYSDGVNGANKYASLADRAEYRLTGNMSIVLKMHASVFLNQTSSYKFITSKRSSINQTFQLLTNNTGSLAFGRTIGGVISEATSSPVLVPSDKIKENLYIKTIFESSNGKLSFYYSYSGVNYTLLSEHFIAVGNSDVTSDTVKILGESYIASRNLKGLLQSIKLYNGLIDGLTNDELSATKVIDTNFDAYTYGQTTGITNSVFGDAVTLSNVQII
jgi:hypothetical protein